MSYVKAGYEPSKAFILACNAFRSQLQGQQVQMPPAPAALAGPSSDGPVALAAAATFTAEELAAAEVGLSPAQKLQCTLFTLSGGSAYARLASVLASTVLQS
jgi:hypothetical protein